MTSKRKRGKKRTAPGGRSAVRRGAQRTSVESVTPGQEEMRAASNNPKPPDGLMLGGRVIGGNALLVAGLGVAIMVSYLPAMLWGDFVWDDGILTTSQAIPQWSGLVRLWFTPWDDGSVEVHYWPLTYTTFWLEHKLWGFHPTGYHVVNVLLHVANTWLLWRILMRIQVPGAWFAALLFAVHPTHVDSVAWVIERKDVLSALMYLLAVWAWLRFLAERRARCYLLTALFLVLGMLSKSVVVTLPVALLIVQWWRQGHLSATDIGAMVPIFAIALGIAALDVWFVRSHVGTPFDYTLLERLLIAARSVWFYLGQIVYPVRFAVVYPYWDTAIANPVNWASLVLGIVVLAVLWFFRGRIGRGPLAGALYFIVTLSPTLSLVDHYYMGFSLVADRFQYLASIGPLVVFGGLAAVLAARLIEAAAREGRWRGALQWGVPSLGLVLVLALGAITWRQSSIYQGPITFFEHIVSHNPKARGAYTDLSSALYREGRLAETMEAARLALEADPEDPKALNNIGLVHETENRPAEAESYYRQALAADERNPTARKNLITLLRAQDRQGEAVAQTVQFLRWHARGPDGLPAVLTAADDLMQLERFADAEKFFRQALMLAPGHAWSTHGLAQALSGQGRHAEVLNILDGLVKSEPENAEVYANRGIALYHLGRHEEAIASFDAALALDPTLDHVRTSRAQILQDMEQP